MNSYDEDAAIEAADDREARRTGGTFGMKYLGPVTAGVLPETCDDCESNGRNCPLHDGPEWREE